METNCRVTICACTYRKMLLSHPYVGCLYQHFKSLRTLSQKEQNMEESSDEKRYCEMVLTSHNTVTEIMIAKQLLLALG